MIVAVGDFSPGDITVSIKQMAAGDNEKHENLYFGGELLRHLDGWGVAQWTDGEWAYKKGIKNILTDIDFDAVAKIRSSAVVMHARYKTVGEQSLENTHPFVDQQTGLILFHNGTIQIPPQPALLTPQGETDSEKLFLCIVERVLEGASVPNAVDAELSALKEFWGANLVVLTKTHAFVTVLHKVTPQYYTMYVGASNSGIIISSERVPLEGVTWTPIENRRLIKICLDDASFEVHHFPSWGGD